MRETYSLSHQPADAAPAFSGELIPFPPVDAPREQLVEWTAVMGTPTLNGPGAQNSLLVRSHWSRAVLAYLERWHPESWEQARRARDTW